MKKKLFLMVLAAFVLLTGCESKTSETDITVLSNGYVFNNSNNTLVIGEEFSKDLFGEPNDYSELTSCAFDGLDRVYTYDHFEVTTYPDGTLERVYSVYLMDSEVSTSEGVKIGDSFSTMVNTYGENYSNTGTLYTYSKDNSVLKFIIDNDNIISIEYSLAD